MGKVCRQCGDIGHVNELVYCFECVQAARHSYCMDDDLLPKTKDQNIRWLCDDCKSSSNQSSLTKSTKRKPEKISKTDQEVIFIKNNWTAGGNIGKNNFSTYSFTAGLIIPSRDRGLKEQVHDDEEPVIIYAEPLIRSAWTGTLDIFQDESTYIRMDGYHAFLSSKACPKVYDVAAQFDDALQFEMLPRFYVWPEHFEVSGPTDDSIALYFFPLLTGHEDYDVLMHEMIRDDLALRTFEGNAELLIFASTMLPPRFWRFQGKLYMWGVIMENQQQILDMI